MPMNKEEWEQKQSQLSDCRHKIKIALHEAKVGSTVKKRNEAKREAERWAAQTKNVIEYNPELKEVFLEGRDPQSRKESLTELNDPDYCEHDTGMLIDKISEKIKDME